MTLLSNHHSGFSVARLLTAVGDSRVSIGPPIITSERGVASPRAAISDTAARTGTVGWQTLTTSRSSAPTSSRQRVVYGKSVSVRVYLVGRRIHKNKDPIAIKT